MSRRLNRPSLPSDSWYLDRHHHRRPTVTDESRIEDLAFDEALSQLEGLAEQLEEGDVPLEQALRVYEEAVVLFRHCRERLGQVEQKLELLTRDLDDNPVTESLPASAEDDG